MTQYVATTDFAIGRDRLPVKKGTLIEFDGTTVILKDNSLTYPQFKAAIRSGWAVATEATAPEPSQTNES